MIIKTAQAPTSDLTLSKSGIVELNLCRAPHGVFFIDVWGDDKGYSLKSEGDSALGLWSALKSSQDVNLKSLEGYEEL